MERYCEPNLPKSRVRRVFVSQLLPKDIESELIDAGITVYKLGRSPNIANELAYHPDILINNFRKGMWICESDPKYLPENLPNEIIKNLFKESETELTDLYPGDCPFNNLRMNHALICGKSADYLIRAYAKYEEHRIIYVPQNYTKCCTIPINKTAVITCDHSIGRTLRENGFDVLTVSDSSEIGLSGYSHGLIGGCAGMIDKDLLVFTGDLNKYKFGDDIRSFCSNYGVSAMSLTSRKMYDYGGILPITEFVPYDEEISFNEECIFNI